MKQCYVEKRFRATTMTIIQQAAVICDEYMAQGLKLTVRQLFYQFVARDLLPNSQSSYRKIKSTRKDARLVGLIDWDAIEDRSRQCFDPQRHVCETAEDLLDGIEHSLIVNLWTRQPSYCEVWVEKDALSNVLEEACADYQVPFLACKDNLSTSEARAATADRFMARIGGQICRRWGAIQNKPAIIFHLADHDPNGIDMTRDLQDRFGLFTRGMVEVRRIALNMDQVEIVARGGVTITPADVQAYLAPFGGPEAGLDFAKSMLTRAHSRCASRK